MKTLTSTLLEAQKASGLAVRRVPRYKVTFSKSGESDVTYEQDRILKCEIILQDEDNIATGTATLLLHNRDKALTDLDFKGWSAVIYEGFYTSAGAEYLTNEAMLVTMQTITSQGGESLFEIKMINNFERMKHDYADHDEANESSHPDTVKTYLWALIEKLWCYEGEAHVITWDSEDGVIDSFKPADLFRIYKNEPRFDNVKQLIGYTENVMRFDENTVLHSFVPTTTGTSYDYEYERGIGNHNFYFKSKSERIVIPNYISIETPKGADTWYGGYATSAESYDLEPSEKWFEMRVTSNDEAEDIAEAMIANLERKCVGGYGYAPINIGAEIYDYVKVTDSITGDTLIGNIGYIRKVYTPESYDFYFSIGKPAVGVIDVGSETEIGSPDWSATIEALHRMIKECSAAIGNIISYIQWLEENGLMFQSIMTKFGDILYRDKSFAQRLAPDAGTGYNFLRSQGAGLPPEWFNIEDLIQYMTGALNRAIATSFVVPVPVFSTLVEEDHSGGGETSGRSFSITVPTFSVAQVAVFDQRYESGDDDDFSIYNDYWEAQTFTTNEAHEFEIVELLLYYVGTPATIGNVTIALKATSSGLPTGANLTSVTFPASDLESSAAWLEKLISGYSLSAATKYAIVVSVSGGDVSNYIIWRGDASAPSYAGGARCLSDDAGSSWSEDTNTDFMFREGEVK